MNILYELKTDTGKHLSFNLQNRTQASLKEMNSHSNVPSWVELKNHKCKMCPYKEQDVRYCPAAFDIQDVIEQCKEFVSYEKVEMSRITSESTIIFKTDMQTALFAIIAEKVLSSACQLVNTRQWTTKYYSLPTSLDAIIYRSLSTYLVRQLILEPSKKNEISYNVDKHISYVDELTVVFSQLCKRIKSCCENDACHNAMIEAVAGADFTKNFIEDWIIELKNEILPNK